jgi:N-glycosylase/DNA lyase
MFSGSIRGISREDLDLDTTLQSGQVFRWFCNEEGVWSGVIGHRFVRLQQNATGDTLHWEATGTYADEAEKAVRVFLRLDAVNLPQLAETWAKEDSLFAEAWGQYPGIRLLQQDPEECFFSFLCASVAPIARIRRMLNAVAEEAGTPLAEGGIAFPNACELTTISEERLRELGLGFRARRVWLAAQHLAPLTPSPLPILRSKPAEEAKAYLCGFTGVGEKIADCILLFSLDKDHAIPVDTHIWRIARTHYLPELQEKSLTPANYARVNAAFYDRFGEYAGWAQQILFFRSLHRNSSPL